MPQSPQTTIAPPPAPAAASDTRAPSPRWGRPAAAAFLLVVLAVNLAYLAVHGAAVGGDTPRYVDGGHALFHGDGLSGRQALYFGYVVLVGLIQLAGLGLSGIVVAHILLTVAATAAVFALGRRLGGTWAGAIAAVLFGLNPELVRWNVYVLPEAPYVAWLPISTWLVERAAADRRGEAWAAISLVVLAALRPNGWIAALLLASYLIVRRLPSWRRRVAAIAAVVVAMSAVGAALPAGRGDTDTVLPGLLLRQGAVIWDYEPSYLAVAPDPTIRDRNWPGFVRYAARHPGDSARVLATRVVVEVRQTRPYYSTSHNLLTLAVIVVLYGTALLGAVVGRRVPLVWLIGLIVLAHLALIALTIADYDGRFGRHYFGLLAVLGGYGLATVLAGRPPGGSGRNAQRLRPAERTAAPTRVRRRRSSRRTRTRT
jgi:hypothetical protein